MDEDIRLCKTHVSLHDCVYKLKETIDTTATCFTVTLRIRFEQYLCPETKKLSTLSSKSRSLCDIDSQLQDAAEEIFRDIREICKDVWTVDKFLYINVMTINKRTF